MSAVLHMQPFNPAPFGLREKNMESFTPAFTSVNGRAPQSPLSNEASQALSTLGPTVWSPGSHRYDSSSDSSSGSTSPTESGYGSPDHQSKRKRCDSEEEPARLSPEAPTSTAEHQSVSYPPPSTYQPERPNQEGVQQRTLPPLNRSEADQRWATEPRESPQNTYQEAERLEAQSFHTTAAPAASPANPPHSLLNVLSDSNHGKESATQVSSGDEPNEVKKRKRQFANRTKTGCGTCRRRKKKCDETKPECNNCTRGSFICEGYASKTPWPKNGPAKSQPALQAKEQGPVDDKTKYPACPVCNQVHFPHCEGSGASQPSSSSQEGASNRPAAGEEERNLPTSGTWSGAGWSGTVTALPPLTSRAPYTSEPHAYAQPHNLLTQERLPMHDSPTRPQQQSEPPRLQASPHAYHRTPQCMSQGFASTLAPVVSAKTVMHHHEVSPHMREPPPLPARVTPPASASAAPPRLYTPQPRLHKSEKEKMLSGLPFNPFDRELINERTHCTGAVYQFNSTANAAVSIASQERGRWFKTIVAARWIPPHTTEYPIVGHLGGNVHVAAPFLCDYGYNLSIAENVVIGSNCELHDSARIAIGMNTRIGNRVTITTLKTPTDVKSLKGSNGTETAQEVFIGKNVYIGDGCIIEAGVRIGDNAIVRAGSVVVRDLPRDCVAHGNPAFG